MTGTVYNRSGGPLVIDEAGHQIDAGERMHGVDLDSEIVAAHVEAERLVVTKRTKGSRRAPALPGDVEAEPTPDEPDPDDSETPDPDADVVDPPEES